MTQARIVIHNVYGMTTVEVPDDVPMNRLIPALVTQMNLPVQQGGNPISYRLDHREAGRRLADGETLADAGVGPDTVLTLRAEMPAGGPDSLAPSEGLAKLEKRITHIETALTELAEAFDSISKRLRSLGSEDTKSLDVLLRAPHVVVSLADRAPLAKQKDVLARLHLARQMEDFNEPEQREFIQSLARLTESSEADISLIEVTVGSVEMLIKMKEDDALKLLKKYLAHDRAIDELGIESIELRPLLPSSPSVAQLPSPINHLSPVSVERVQPPVSYLDFDITFAGKVAECRAAALWLDGSQRVDGNRSFKMPLTLTELELDYLRNMGLVSRSGSRVYELAVDLGKMLFDAVFQETVRDCFRNCQARARNLDKGIRVRLDLKDAPELINYPWEFLWSEEDGFLAASDYTPVIRYLRSTRESQTTPLQPPLRMLVVTASPVGHVPLNVEQEKENLRGALKELAESNQLEIEWLDHATPRQLHQRLGSNRQLNILHYIGHGDINDCRGGYLLLENESGAAADFMDARQLTVMLHDHRRMRLVTLNTCRGARAQADDPFASIAMSLVNVGIPAVVAMQLEINDHTAISFSRYFYGYLAAGSSVHEAMSRTRKALFVDQKSEIEWAIPVLYSCLADGLIFEPTGSAKQ